MECSLCPEGRCGIQFERRAPVVLPRLLLSNHYSFFSESNRGLHGTKVILAVFRHPLTF